jgi:hypothetical protein
MAIKHLLKIKPPFPQTKAKPSTRDILLNSFYPIRLLFATVMAMFSPYFSGGVTTHPPRH